MSQSAIVINQGTQTSIATDAIGGTQYGIVKLDMGTLGVSNPFSGTIPQVSNIGTLPNLPGGTLNNLASGTINSATISSLPNLPQGSITVTAGTIATLGTMGTLGLINTVTTVSNLTNGSIHITAGTEVISSGSITVIAGTIGTVTNLGQVYNAGTLQGGTINTGTINLGTFQSNPLPVLAVSTYGTHGTTGVSIFGTLAGGTGSGAGTEIFLTSLSLSIPSTGGSQDVSIGWGTNGGTFQAGTGLIVRGNFPPGGGIQKEFNPAINSGTNAQLCLFQAGAGTVDVNVTYFTTPSSL